MRNLAKLKQIKPCESAFGLEAWQLANTLKEPPEKKKNTNARLSAALPVSTTTSVTKYFARPAASKRSTLPGELTSSPLLAAAYISNTVYLVEFAVASSAFAHTRRKLFLGDAGCPIFGETHGQKENQEECQFVGGSPILRNTWQKENHKETLFMGRSHFEKHMAKAVSGNGQ